MHKVDDKRHPWVAVALSFINASLAMLYLGRPRRAGVYVVAMLICPVAAFVLARNGLWPTGLPWAVVVYPLAIVGIVDAYRIAKRHVGTESRGVYSDDPRFDLVRETIDSRSHSVVRIRGTVSAGGTYRVPEGSYFVLGDNRDNSFDSRHGNFGFVPATSIVGKVTLVWWNDDQPERAGILPE